MRKYIIILAVLAMPHIVVQAYQSRGYFAVGGEWLLVPLALIIIYGLAPTVVTFVKECGINNKIVENKESEMYK